MFEGLREIQRSAMGAPKALVVGGSIAGLSCAHALISAGWQVTVVEKSPAPPSGSPTGAGLGLDTQSQHFLSRWISDPDLLNRSTLPLSIDENRATDSKEKTSRMLTRDESYNFRAAQWAELHSIIHAALPPDVVLWGHQFLSFHVSDDKLCVEITARVLQTDQIVTISGDLLVAADGCLSTIREHYLPDFKLRYSGYCAWRGVLNFSGKEHSETILGLRRAYPELGNCLYFDLATRTHSVFYELTDKRINWLWYVNMPEPELKLWHRHGPSSILQHHSSPCRRPRIKLYYRQTRGTPKLLPLQWCNSSSSIGISPLPARYSFNKRKKGKENGAA